MVQVIQRTPTGLESILSSLGTGVGTGLSQGMQALANLRLSEMQQRAAAQRGIPALESLGFKPEAAQALTGLDPKILQEVVKQQLRAPQQAAYLQALQGLMGEPTVGQQASVSQMAEAPIEGAGVAPVQIPAGITEQQATKLAELGFKQKEFKQKERLAEEKRQLQLSKINEPIVNKIEEKAVPARKVVNAAQDAMKILKSGKAYTGLLGKITPTYLQSEEGQVLQSLLNQIVLQQAQRGKGLPSKFRLILEQGAKADVWQQPKVIENILQQIINDPENIKDAAQAEAAEQILAESEGKQIPDLRARITERSKEIIKQKKAEIQTGIKAEDLEGIDTAQLKYGDPAYDDQTGEQFYWNGNQFVKEL